MGFMGIGYQKWIYTQRSRKPFSSKRKPHHSKLGNSPTTPYTFTPGKSTDKPKRKVNIFSFLAIISLFLVAGIAHGEWKKLVAYHNHTIRREQINKPIDPELFIQKYIRVRIRRGHWDYAQEDIDFLRKNHPQNQVTEYLSLLLQHKKATTLQDTLRAREMMIRHVLTYPSDTDALHLMRADTLFYSDMVY